MPKTLRQVLTSLAEKAKINMLDDQFVGAMSAPDLDRLTVPDEFFDSIDNNLIEMGYAQSHPDIKNKHFAAAYDGLDKGIFDAMEEFKLPEDVRNEIKAEKSSTKRAILLARKAAAIEAKKHSTGNVDKEKYAKEIADLNDSIRQLKEADAVKESNFQKQLRDNQMSYAMKDLMGTYNNTIHEHLPPQVKAQIIEAQLNVALKENNASWGLDDNGKVTLLRSDGQPVYGPNNTPLSPKTFIDKTLADNKQFKVTEPAFTTPAATYQQRPAQQGNQNGSTPAFVPGNKTANSTVVNRNMQQLLDMEANAAKSGASMF